MDFWFHRKTPKVPETQLKRRKQAEALRASRARRFAQKLKVCLYITEKQASIKEGMSRAGRS